MLAFLETAGPIYTAMSALYGVLAVASLSVGLAARKRFTGMLSDQVNSWWRIFPIISLALMAYPLGLVLLAYVIVTLAVLELGPHYPGAQREFRFGAVLVAATASMLYWSAPTLSLLVLFATAALQGLRFWRRPDARVLIWLLLWSTVGAMATVVAFSRLSFSTGANCAWLFYLFTLTALNDIGQFVAGKLFGRNKIAPTVSPNKTWQGLLGGLVVSQCVSHAIGVYLELGTPVRLAGYAVVLSLGGFVGDLMFSAAKRYLSIKDFSQLIPGHGGILDRVDSLVVTGPLLYCLLSTSP